MKSISPKLPAGVRDYLPSQMIARQQMIETIRGVYERFGFVPLDSPGLEFESVLTGDSKDFEMRLFRTRVITGARDSVKPMKYDPKRTIALRFDLTVPLARIIATNPGLKKPFKRYQIGRVWRGESPQAGRYREFVQFDADIVGSSSMLADAEIINIMYEVLRSLGVKRFVIRFNNRKVLNGLPDYAGFEAAKIKPVLRILDKVEKVGPEKMAQELMKKPSKGLDQSSPGLSPRAVEKILEFQKISGEPEEVLQVAESKFKGIPIAEEGLQELSEISRYLKVLGIPSEHWSIDFGIARGLDYYTGPVFEAFLVDLPELGSVYSGGRYDGLISRFDPSSKIPATGASIGVDRLFTALERQGLIKFSSTVTQVLVTILDRKYLDEYLRIAQRLRGAGVNTELYLGRDESFKAQFAYAVRQEIPLVIIAGDKELSQQCVTLRNLITRQEQLVAIKKLVSEVRKQLR